MSSSGIRICIINWGLDMKRVIVIGLTLLSIVPANSVSAVDRGCAFKKTVRQSGITFDISSRPAAGCAVQIVTISAIQGGKAVAVIKADVDYLARSAQAADLTEDGKPELIIFSKTAGSFPTETLDVYYFEGKNLRRAAMPELGNKNGYKGGDRFHLEGRQIIRTIPINQSNDPAEKPSEAIRTIKYDFNDGKILLNNLTDNPVIATPPPEKTVFTPVLTKLGTGRAPAAATASIPEIIEIRMTETGIEIMADRPIEKFKTMRLDKPDRIAIDIPGGTSKLSGKKIDIKKFGVSRARVGLNKGFLRIVLDPALEVFPEHTITTSKNSLIIQTLNH